MDFESGMRLKAGDADKLESANDTIGLMNRYGRRTEVMRAGGRVFSWSNADASWWPYARDLQPKRGDEVSLDANQVVLYGITNGLSSFLDPLPLYGSSHEGKSREVSRYLVDETREENPGWGAGKVIVIASLVLVSLRVMGHRS